MEAKKVVSVGAVFSPRWVCVWMVKFIIEKSDKFFFHFFFYVLSFRHQHEGKKMVFSFLKNAYDTRMVQHRTVRRKEGWKGTDCSLICMRICMCQSLFLCNVNEGIKSSRKEDEVWNKIIRIGIDAVGEFCMLNSISFLLFFTRKWLKLIFFN